MTVFDQHSRFDESNTDHEGSKPHQQPGVVPKDFASEATFPPDRNIAYALSKRGIQSNYWERCEGIAPFRKRLTNHVVQNNKDGDAFFLGSLHQKLRKAVAVERVDGLVIDIDDAMDAEIALLFATLNDADIYFDAYTTHSHLRQVKEVKFDDFIETAKAAGLFPLQTEEQMDEVARLCVTGAEGLARDRDGKPRLAEQSRDGTVAIVRVPPKQKWRIVLYFDQGYCPSTLAAFYGVSDTFVRDQLWKICREKFLRTLNVKTDEACDGIEHAYYGASCPADTRDKARVVQGTGRKCLSLFALLPSSAGELNELLSKSQSKARRNSAKRPSNQTKHRLAGWIGRYGPTFDIETLMEDRGLSKGPRSDGGSFVECDREESHQASHGRTWCKNGDGDANFTLSCSGGTGDCRHRDRLDRLEGYIQNGSITEADLEDPTYGGGPINGQPSKDSVRDAVAKLRHECVSEEYDGVLEDLSAIGDDPFTAEICEDLARKAKGARKSDLCAEVRRRRNRKQKGRATDDAPKSRPGVKEYVDYQFVPFHEHLGEVVRDLAAYNTSTPKLFVQGSQIVRLTTNIGTGLKEINVCDVEAIRAHLSKVASWARTVDAEEAGQIYIHAPKDVAHAILREDTCSLGLPELIGIAATPYLDRTHCLRTEEGYCAESKIYLSPPASGKDLPPIPSAPSTEQVREAVALLIDAYWDIPFNDDEDVPDGWFDSNCIEVKTSIGQASRANQLARTLQPMVSPGIDGHLPLGVTDKPTPRTGSQVMTEVMSIIAFGTPTPMTSVPNNDEEWQKTLITLAQAGTPHVVFDNAKVAITSGALASAIGGSKVQARALRFNHLITGDYRPVTEINGNNLNLDTDLCERAILVRLDTKLTKPGERKRFKHDPLRSWCVENRPKLLWACLTIIQNWIAKGRPRMSDHSRVLGGFEEYCRIMGGILEAAGIEGFNANRHLIRKEAAIDEMETFLAEMLDVFGTSDVKVGTVDHAETRSAPRYATYGEEVLVELLIDVSDCLSLGLMENPNRASLGSRLGRKLNEYVGRVFEIKGARYKLSQRTLNGYKQYRLAPLEDAPEIARKPAGALRAGTQPP